MSTSNDGTDNVPQFAGPATMDPGQSNKNSVSAEGLPETLAGSSALAGPSGRHSRSQKPRNSEASKAAILESAQAAFSKKSYDEVGLREIATGAQIDPALIIRYFGSKEGLFREIVKRQFHTDGLAGIPLDHYPEMFSELIFANDENVNQKNLLLLHLSATSLVAGPIIEETLRERLVKPISLLVGGADAELRIEILMAILGGLSTARHITKQECIAKAAPEKLKEVVGPLFKHLIFGRS